MVLVYLPTKLDDFRANVGKYSVDGAFGILDFKGIRAKEPFIWLFEASRQFPS